MILFDQIYKNYEDGTKAVNDISFEIKSGEFVTIIGPSGSGKTTTLKMINRLIEPTTGSIYIDNKNIKEYNIHELRWNIGYVLQEIALFPHLTVEENISVVPEMKKWSRKEMKQRGKDLLDMVGLDPSIYAKRMPNELSGGEQQRVGVIRALAADPNIILMDEPFSALDPISRDQLKHDISTLQKEIKKTIVFVTHDIDEALALGDKVCLMKEGRIVQYDTPQNLVLNPKNEFVKQFVDGKKSLWQTSIDVVANQSTELILSEKEFENNHYFNQSLLFLVDQNNEFISLIENGKKIKGRVLQNNMTLDKAARVLQSEDQYIYPVLKNHKLVGTLSYKDIVTYLQENIEEDDGVIQK